MDRDEEDDYVFYGTPIDKEEDKLTCKKKAIADSAGHLRSLPLWKQEVRDEEGRRRFHGAFTGGFSAGYYNTVGSKEGWAPQTFTSSRKKRADVAHQSILNFLDDDEKSELEGGSLGLSTKFDTFGFTSADAARRHSSVEQQRPSLIPGPVPDELIVPAPDSVGVKLLVKMGWRQGTSVKNRHTDSLYESRREARKALIALSFIPGGDTEPTPEPEHAPVAEETMESDPTESTPLYVLNPKQNLHGLGYDPFKNAPEFREKRRSLVETAPGFGIGALEEPGLEDQDVYGSSDSFSGFCNVLEEEEEDEKRNEKGKVGSVFICRFKVALNSDFRQERFDRPTVPNNWSPRHKFTESKTEFLCAPPEADPPRDRNVRIMIEGIAGIVARSGKVFEDLSREKGRSNPLFSFLDGGEGHEYYARRLWDEQQKCCKSGRKPEWGEEEEEWRRKKKMTAERRGEILGERVLERREAVDLPFKLEDTFTKPAVGKPFIGDLEKQERFEQFLWEKLHGGLHSGGSSLLSESARARERLDFEAATEGMTGGGKGAAQGEVVFVPGKGSQSEVPTLAPAPAYPVREEAQWRPFAILCKRFDVADPFMGKPPPPPRSRTKMDSLLFSLTASSSSKKPEGGEEIGGVVAAQEKPCEGVVCGNGNRPVDLYKAIFSDDSEEGEGEKEEEEDKGEKNVGAGTATLNRLIAGDFLESLGKQLGMEVPSEKEDGSHWRRKERGEGDNGRRKHRDRSSLETSFGCREEKYRRVKEKRKRRE